MFYNIFSIAIICRKINRSIFVNLTSKAAGEKTEVLDKFEDILACALDILPRIRKSHDLCLDKWGPSAVLGNETVTEAFIAVHQRGANIRLITEITDVNMTYCKEFMKFAKVRHLDRVKGNFSVSDGKWYTASAVAEKDQPPPRLIYSSVKEIADQHQYFFETLWEKAVPAEQRIGEIEGRTVTEKTEIGYGEENSLNILLGAMARTKKEALACSSSIIPIFCMTVEPVKAKIVEAKSRGVKARQITEITKDNIPYCKEFMKYVELRHMSNIQGNMVVTDNNEYVAAASVSPSSVPQAIYSNARTIIEQQRLFFENLWSKSIPAEQRIREIEEGIQSINLEILSSNQESGARGLKMVENAREEVLILFPAVNVLNATFDVGIVALYNQVAKRGVTMKILVQIGEESPSSVDVARKKMFPSIEVRTFHDGHNSKRGNEGIKMSILVADNKEAIVWNMLDMDTNDLYQMAGNAIYSSNPSVVSSYHAIFSSLWKQVEMYELIRTHDELQKEFINIAAHELRTPIQPLLGTAELLESALESAREVMVTKDDIDLIIRNARRLERLSSDILTISRIESQSFNLNIENANLGQTIQQAIDDAKSYIKDNQQLHLIFEPPADPVMLQADNSKVHEVLSNLLRNAIKFTEKGTIIVSLNKQDGQAVVSIRDTGTGIYPEIMPRLFEKFATKGEKEGGTGLGLFISKTIIEAHGGKIWAENNKDGKGATFAFALPISSK